MDIILCNTYQSKTTYIYIYNKKLRIIENYYKLYLYVMKNE